jgi:hypothetical protein
VVILVKEKKQQQISHFSSNNPQTKVRTQESQTKWNRRPIRIELLATLGLSVNRTQRLNLSAKVLTLKNNVTKNPET